jgi:hypothetical protein
MSQTAGTEAEGSAARPRIRVSEVGEFVRHHSCQRRFKLDANKRALTRRLPFSERLFNPLDFVLSARGADYEARWEEDLVDDGYAKLASGVAVLEEDNRFPQWSDFVAALENLDSDTPAYGREVRLTGPLDAFDVEGRADFLVLLWREGQPILRVVECKASRRDRTYQRLQVAFYSLLIKSFLVARPATVNGKVLGPDQVECVVARIDSETNEQQNILDLQPLDISLEEADALRLVAADGTLAAILATPLDELGYQLDAKCDGCVFSPDCLPEAARQRRHELLGISAPTAAALRQAGIDTIDDLAELDSTDPRARQVRADPSFTEPIERLRTLAGARRSTLPGGNENPDNFRVQSFRPAPTSQLPEHEQGGQRLVRVYLSVDYDYTENRIGALAAHITKSSDFLTTDWQEESEERRGPIPGVCERTATAGEEGRRVWSDPKPLTGSTIATYQTSEWSGEYRSDTGSERQLLQSFIHDLIAAVASLSEQGQVKLHFYVWSRSEMSRLVEACSRTSSRLLSALRELLGCRESTEQLIYSCVQEEVNRRYALGWTGRGLSVVTSLPWFGRRYHWRREVTGEVIDLDHVFTQDIFDFKTTLDLTSTGDWAKNKAEAVASHRFEIRSRFHDSLPAPYWHAVWDTLPDPNDPTFKQHANVRNSIIRYEAAGRIGMLRAYLEARVHALRWVEEGIRFKNSDILKPTLQVEDLRRFTLGIDDVSAAAVDFLRLDHFVKQTDWTAANIQPPAGRVPTGRTLPLRDVRSLGRGRLAATIHLDDYDLDLAALRARSPFGEGAMCRISPYSGDPYSGQTIRQLTSGIGRTAFVSSLDWDTGEVELDEIYGTESRYILPAIVDNEPEDLFPFATMDESPSDFVAGRVEKRLRSGLGSHIYPWFDPERPRVPERQALTPQEQEAWSSVLDAVRFEAGFELAPDQKAAVLEGLDARMQVLQGPPGTGKTQTTSAAMLVRAAQRLAPGGIVLVSAHTHTAVDTLLGRLAAVLPAVETAARDNGVNIPSISLGRVYATDIPAGGSAIPGALDIKATSATRAIDRLRAQGVAVIGGTTSTILKMVEKLDAKVTWQRQGGFSVPLLVVDEGSMMVLPHFLALATLVRVDGDILVAGDHRQLEPIVAHDWDHEDRPPAVAYQPFSSAFNAIRSIGARDDISDHAVRRSALEVTFRLPPLITDVIARLYRLDEIELKSLKEDVHLPLEVEDDSVDHGLEQVWHGNTGLFLVLHNERDSRQSNELEVELVQSILNVGGGISEGSVAIITPHRAQRSLLTASVTDASVGVIDTVERLQGGERPTIIVSGTASHPAAIASNARFLLDLNRSNVAFSRAQERLIVVCAQALLDALPAELEDYHSALLWKSLRALCTRQVARGEVHGHTYSVYTVPRRLDH